MRILWLLASLAFAAAEDGSKAWLRYAPAPQASRYRDLPAAIVVLNTTKSSPVYTAGVELQKGIQGIFGKQLVLGNGTANGTSSIVVGSAAAYKKAYGGFEEEAELEGDGFWLSIEKQRVTIVGQNERGALYGAFEYLSRLAQGNFDEDSFVSNPSAPIRWTNEWDNLDGSIERGYGGKSIFFSNGVVVGNLTRVAEYARLLASIRVNAVVLNNVNANANILNATNIDGIGRIADAMRPYGVQVGMAQNFAAPKNYGGLETYDPLDKSVVAFWTNITNQIYARVPDMAGYLIKANSEGQPGPLTYNRTLADGANLFAKAVRPYGGVVMFRAFVYDNKIDPRNWKADRANAQVDFFKHLDGKFDENVVVQIKYGPIDFQVREPASPLFANLLNTNTAIELQVTQEYLGQQCHMVYIAPLWKEILDFDLRAESRPSRVKDIVSGERFKRPLGGYAAVVNVGTDANWLGHHLALANLYAYGRMAWDPSSDPEEILQDWIRLTFSSDRGVLDAITEMSMLSWPAYENYTGNLGVQTLTDILYTHFGPNPASQDNNGWGQWTRADKNGIGMDRTVKNGTGNAGQYPAELATKYEKIATTPDDLLLWFHHVPYTQRLHSGKTVIQHFYDAHYAGAATAQTFVPLWESLKGKIDPQRYEEVLFRQTYQAGHSIIWRDAINGFYRNLSGIPDIHHRVWNHTTRLEAENMELNGYKTYTVFPYETASNATAIVTVTNTTIGTATTKIPFPDGTYDIAVAYYDPDTGIAKWELAVNNRTIGSWQGDLENRLGKEKSRFLDGHTAARFSVKGVKVKRGDVLRVLGTPDRGEGAAVDYVEFERRD